MLLRVWFCKVGWGDDGIGESSGIVIFGTDVNRIDKRKQLIIRTDEGDFREIYLGDIRRSEWVSDPYIIEENK